MAVSTGVNEMLLDEVFGLYTAAEQIMLKKLANRIKKGVTTPGWNEQKLADVGSMRMELEAALAKIHGTAMPLVTKSIIQSHIAGMNKINKDLKLPNTILKDMSIPWHVQRLVLEANGIIKGASLQILRSSEDIYKKVITDSTSVMLTGVETRLAASQRALNVFAAKGITGFVDKAGRNWEMSSYVEMATRTASSRAALQGHTDRSSELGHDLMVVSQFGKTCPLCAPWEGKPISISGKTPGYPSLDSVKAAGLFHPNCKHTLLAYFPGITELPQREPNDDQGYQDMQQQRYNERQIRKNKRLEAAAMTPVAASQARSKVLAWQQTQRDFMEKTGLRRKYHREGIKNRDGNPAAAMFGKHTVTFDNEQKIMLGIQHTIANPATITKPITITKPKPKPKPHLGMQSEHDQYSNMSIETLLEEKKSIESKMANIGSEKAKERWQKHLDIIEFYIPNAKSVPIPVPAPTLAPLGIPQPLKPKYDPNNYALLGWNETNTLKDYAHKLWSRTLGLDDSNAASKYVRTGNSFSMNEMLYSDRYSRAKSDSFVYDALRTSEKRHINEIDDFSEVIQKTTIPMDMRVVRNVDSSFIQGLGNDLGISSDIDKAIDSMNQGKYTPSVAKILREKLSGIQYENKSFISTSYDPSLNVFTGRPVQIEFMVDKGTKGLVTQNVDESEIVFDKGTRIEIVDVVHMKDHGDDKIKIIAKIL